MHDKELTKKILGDVGPLRFNPYVIKICQGCGHAGCGICRGGCR